jgi:hypothetical protein
MELPHVILLRLVQQEKPQGDGAIIVKLLPPESELAALSDVLIGSLGLSGALALVCMLLGLVVGGLLFWVRRRSA